MDRYSIHDHRCMVDTNGSPCGTKPCCGGINEGGFPRFLCFDHWAEAINGEIQFLSGKCHCGTHSDTVVRYGNSTTWEATCRKCMAEKVHLSLFPKKKYCDRTCSNCSERFSTLFTGKKTLCDKCKVSKRLLSDPQDNLHTVICSRCKQEYDTPYKGLTPFCDTCRPTLPRPCTECNKIHQTTWMGIGFICDDCRVSNIANQSVKKKRSREKRDDADSRKSMAPSRERACSHCGDIFPTTYKGPAVLCPGCFDSKQKQYHAEKPGFKKNCSLCKNEFVTTGNAGLCNTCHANQTNRIQVRQLHFGNFPVPRFVLNIASAPLSDTDQLIHMLNPNNQKK